MASIKAFSPCQGVQDPFPEVERNFVQDTCRSVDRISAMKISRRLRYWVSTQELCWGSLQKVFARHLPRDMEFTTTPVNTLQTCIRNLASATFSEECQLPMLGHAKLGFGHPKVLNSATAKLNIIYTYINLHVLKKDAALYFPRACANRLYMCKGNLCVSQ